MKAALAPLMARLRAWRDRRLLLRSGLFDPAWYRRAHLDLPRSSDPVAHFLATGVREGRKPNPLFDTKWYVEQNPDVVREGANPVMHYLSAGAVEARDPNPFFSSAWYLSAYPDVAAAGVNPLCHYLAYGAAEGRRPSPRFDPDFYLRQLPQDEPGRTAPLVHYLTSGADRGLKPAPEVLERAGEPVEWADIVAVRAWTGPPAREIALFVTHPLAGRLKPHVHAHLEALGRAGVDVVLVVAGEADVAETAAAGPLAGVYLRANVGFDFAAWAHLLKLLPELWDAPGLYLVNDSVIGPIGEQAYQAMMHGVRSSTADVVGLTESRERGWHLQSYFLFLRPTALRHARIQSFFNAVRSVGDKQAVIDGYELALAGEAVAAGLKVEALFRKGAETNSTLFAWRSLLAEGYPFLKAAVVTERHDTVDSSGWREALQTAGADPALGEALLSRPPTGRSPLAVRAAETVPWTPGRIAFYGPWNYANGLGEAARGYLSALWRLECGLNLHGLKTPFHIHRRLAPGYDVRDFVEAADAAIVHLNPDAWQPPDHRAGPRHRKGSRADRSLGLGDGPPARLLPAQPRQGGCGLDAQPLLCGGLRRADTPARHVVPHVVTVPIQTASDGSDRRTILYIFDGSSYLARKNPLALVEAFAISRLANRGWRLMLKTKNLADHPAQARALVERCTEVDGVTLIDQPLSREQMARLMEEAAIYASPHASEGFGLTIAEAMAAGKVVVATDYGGSRDVLDGTCGLPVAYDLINLTEDYGHYRRGVGGRRCAWTPWLRPSSGAPRAWSGASVPWAPPPAPGSPTCSPPIGSQDAMRTSFAKIAPLAAGIETRRGMARA